MSVVNSSKRAAEEEIFVSIGDEVGCILVSFPGPGLGPGKETVSILSRVGNCVDVVCLLGAIVGESVGDMSTVPIPSFDVATSERMVPSTITAASNALR